MKPQLECSNRFYEMQRLATLNSDLLDEVRLFLSIQKTLLKWKFLFAHTIKFSQVRRPSTLEY